MSEPNNSRHQISNYGLRADDFVGKTNEEIASIIADVVFERRTKHNCEIIEFSKHSRKRVCTVRPL